MFSYSLCNLVYFALISTDTKFTKISESDKTFQFSYSNATTVSIRIVVDCVGLSCQVTQKLKRATTLEFTTESAIIFIHC